MKHNNSSSLGERAIDELREFAIIAAYLFVCFAAVAYFKASILKAHGVSFAPFGFAIAKALICAKFVSMGHIFHIGERFKSLPLIWPTLYKSFCFLAVLVVLNALEEMVVGLVHRRHHCFNSLANFGGGTLDQLIAASLIGFLIVQFLFLLFGRLARSSASVISFGYFSILAISPIVTFVKWNYATRCPTWVNKRPFGTSA